MTPGMWGRIMSPGLLVKAARTFDRATLLIMGFCWLVTILSMVAAGYVTNLAVEQRAGAEAAAAMEPVLPKITRGGAGGKELQALVDGLKKRYPQISVTWQNNTLTLAGANGGVYHQWLMAIGQADTLYPQFHWKIKSLCVGKGCESPNIMSIELMGEQVGFEMPQIEEKSK